MPESRRRFYSLPSVTSNLPDNAFLHLSVVNTSVHARILRANRARTSQMNLVSKINMAQRSTDFARTNLVNSPPRTRPFNLAR